MPLTSLIAYARRGYTTDRYGVEHPTTFVSADRADNIPMGWFHGWVEDGRSWESCELVHVYEPSFRVKAPASLSQVKAA